ncbi:hypothetical protein LJC35_04370 [Parabacteroides sp. OttesenSCG-928-N08]|nr:hypothetical protein [Parabacteroides sp. OttesenSCG-928-N08]
MSFISTLFKKKEQEEAATGRTVEEFMMLVRVYYQAVMAVNLGISNLNMLPDLSLFKRMLKVTTQGNKPGLAERSRVKKILMQDYGLQDYFFQEIDASVKKNCRTMQHVQPYFYQFQGFCTDLFNLIDSSMSLTFRASMLFKSLLRSQTEKMVHKIFTKTEWKEVSQQKAAWAVRKYAETLGYSEQWTTALVYNILVLAKESAKQNRKKK